MITSDQSSSNGSVGHRHDTRNKSRAGSIPSNSQMAAAAKQGKGRSEGTKNYNEDTIKILLGFIWQIKPIGGDQWERVLQKYNAETGETRDVDSIKRKFQGLCNSKIKTGDPHCPDTVKEAKRIHWSLRGQADVSTLGYEDDHSEDRED